MPLQTLTNFLGVPLGLANAWLLGCTKLGEAPPLGLTRQENAPQLPGGNTGRSWNCLMPNNY